MNKKIVFIVDDSIPKPKESVNDAIYENPITTNELVRLSKNNIWKGELNLQKTVDNLTLNDYTTEGLIEVYGFIHPEICLIAIESGILPDVIIYDWEYGNSLPNQNSGDLLLEILETTTAFIFVYSGVFNMIPPTLNKSKFNPFSDRFQLLAKGNHSHLIFSSEEFIYQYVVSLINKSNNIKIQGIEIDFKSNGYLNEPSDILYLEQIFGRAFIVDQLKKNSIINDEAIEQMLSTSESLILFNEEKKMLVTPENKSLIGKGSYLALNYMQVIKKFSVQILEETLEKGLLIL